MNFRELTPGSRALQTSALGALETSALALQKVKKYSRAALNIVYTYKMTYKRVPEEKKNSACGEPKLQICV